MAKVLEGPGMGLMKKWGILVPSYAVVTSVDELQKLGEANEWLKKSKLVVKAHEALGVSSTPTFFVAGKRLADEQGLDKFDAILAPAAK